MEVADVSMAPKVAYTSVSQEGTRMDNVARGGCGSCGEPQVYMIWKNGRRTLVVQCQCGMTNNFSVEGLEEALGYEDVKDPLVTMLEVFVPTGRPS